MNSQQILFKVALIALFFSGVVSYGQKQSKTYNETFNVSEDAVLNLNTSHTDIEFETWDKNQVVIEAIVELEGATDEEAKAYFEQDIIKIMGNSREIEVNTEIENTWFLSHSTSDFQNFEIPNIQHFLLEIPEMPEMESILEMPEVVEAMELVSTMRMPPMPAVVYEFDYKAYKKDGEKYLKKWKKKFDKGFDEDYQKEIEEWGKEMESIQEELQEQRKENREAMLVQREAMLEQREAMREEREERREVIIEQREARREAVIERRELLHEERNKQEHRANSFYFIEEGKGKNFKIKKTIKIKMPKSTKLKMNVRHGEVKLAENARNINATLSYTRLLASTIDGENTMIKASYSPVSVQKWNYGSLKADYSENVELKEVKELIFSGISSNITIGNLFQKAIIENKLGALKINAIANSFTELDVSVEHGELGINLPTTAYVIYLNGKNSEVNYPKELVVDTSDSFGNLIIKGYHLNKNNDKTIVINSKYSEVVLEE